MLHLEQFVPLGYGDLGALIDPSECARLLAEMTRRRHVGPENFMSQTEYESGQYPLRSSGG